MVINMAKQNEELTMKEKPAEPKSGDVKPTPGKVQILYGGSSGYEIHFPGRGNKIFARGDVIELDPADIMELRAILCIMKDINSPRRNAYIVVTNKLTNETKRMERFTPVGETLNALPKILREHRHTAEGGYTNDERAAIKSLCPDFPFEKKRQQIMMSV